MEGMNERRVRRRRGIWFYSPPLTMFSIPNNGAGRHETRDAKDTLLGHGRTEGRAHPGARRGGFSGRSNTPVSTDAPQILHDR